MNKISPSDYPVIDAVHRAVNLSYAITRPPKAKRQIVEVALSRCGPDDVGLLKGLLNGMTGDWRRAAVRKRIAELEKEAHG